MKKSQQTQLLSHSPFSHEGMDSTACASAQVNPCSHPHQSIGRETTLCSFSFENVVQTHIRILHNCEKGFKFIQE